MKKQTKPFTPIGSRLFSSCSNESGYLSQASEATASASASPFQPIKLDAPPEAMDTTEDKTSRSPSLVLPPCSFFSTYTKLLPCEEDKELEELEAQRILERTLENPIASHLLALEEPLRFDKSTVTKRDHENKEDDGNVPLKMSKADFK